MTIKRIMVGNEEVEIAKLRFGGYAYSGIRGESGRFATAHIAEAVARVEYELYAAVMMPRTRERR